MKEITIEQLPPEMNSWLDAAQQERILVTRNGEPVAVLVGLENKDKEDWQLESSPDFWRIIQERRQEPTVPLENLKAELLAGE